MDAAEVGASVVDDQKIALACRMNVSTIIPLCP